MEALYDIRLLDERLGAIEKAIADLAIATKEILTMDETSAFTGIAKNTLYGFTSTQKIPHYKPNGKNCYFKRSEIEAWMLQNRIATHEEIEQKAQTYCMNKKK
jgi:excisionase family DNA binding protein